MGQIISMSIVIGTISQIMTRYLSTEIASAPSWKSYVKLSQLISTFILEFQSRDLEFQSRDLEFQSRDLEFKDGWSFVFPRV